MQLEKIISISGKPGLFKLVSQLKNGFIIEDVITKKKMSIGNSSQVSLLDNIAMFTFDKEVPLFDVFENLAKKEDYKPSISHKSTDQELRDLMDIALPSYDTDRVYVSDIKKLVQWYNLLQKAGFITPESFVKQQDSEQSPLEVPAKEDAESSAKKVAAKAKKPAAPKAKAASSSSKSQVKSTLRKQG